MKLYELTSETEAKQLLRRVTLKLTELYPELKWERGDLDEETGEIFDNGKLAVWHADKQLPVIRIYTGRRYTRTRGESDDYLIQVSLETLNFKHFLTRDKTPSISKVLDDAERNASLRREHGKIFDAIASTASPGRVNSSITSSNQYFTIV